MGITKHSTLMRIATIAELQTPGSSGRRWTLLALIIDKWPIHSAKKTFGRKTFGQNIMQNRSLIPEKHSAEKHSAK